MYVRITKKTYACVRHKIWRKLEEHKRKTNSDSAPAKEIFDKIQEEISSQIEDIRANNYEILM